MIKAVKAFLNKYFNNNIDLDIQTFNLLGFAGMATSLLVAVISAVQDMAISAVICVAAFLLAFALIRAAGKKISYRVCCWIIIIAVFIIAFPAIFFFSGGYKSGMLCYFLFATIFTATLLGKYERTVALTVEFVLYIGCCLIAYYFPESISHFTTESDYLIDVITAIMLCGILLTLVILLHQRMYNLRQKQLENANYELQGLNRMKTEFMQNISHELKTPLTIMCNYALDTQSELREQNLNVPEMEFNQARIRSEGERLKRMVSQLLDATAIEGGRMQIKKEPLSLVALLSRVADANFNYLNENGNRAVIEIPDKLPDIYADKDAVEQVLLNLMSNAARHTHHGIITMSLSSGNGWQEVRVSDTGEGISPDVLSQVFLQYVERESRVIGRSGLGLYICKKYIDAHGGNICIESEPGKGTTIWFRLPNL